MQDMIFKQVPLYRFLEMCQQTPVSETKRILDCGAGGTLPPIALFEKHGFQAVGIEIDESAIAQAKQFGSSNGLALNLMQADMTQLPFDNASFDYVYSYNSIFHMRKTEVAKAVHEMKRVLKPGGLMFVNFLSTDDFRCGDGPHLGDNQYEQMDDEPVIHSYYAPNEADVYFEEMALLVKEQRIIHRIYEGELIRQGFVDYILKK